MRQPGPVRTAVSMIVMTIASQAHAVPWTFRIVGDDGQPTPARVIVRESSGTTYFVPVGELSWLMIPAPGRFSGAEYFYTNGEFTLDASARSLELTVRKGLEYTVVERTVT